MSFNDFDARDLFFFNECREFPGALLIEFIHRYCPPRLSRFYVFFAPETNRKGEILRLVFISILRGDYD